MYVFMYIGRRGYCSNYRKYLKVCFTFWNSEIIPRSWGSVETKSTTVILCTAVNQNMQLCITKRERGKKNCLNASRKES